MTRLFKIAFFENKYRVLLIITIFSMLLLTLASQLEIFAIGAITKKGPDAFELFGPMKDNQLGMSDAMSKADIDQRWLEMNPQQKPQIDNADVMDFYNSHKKKNIIDKLIDWLDSIYPITGNFSHLAILLVCVAIFKAISMFAQRYCSKVISIRISKDLRQSYFEHIQALPMKFYQQHNIGTLSSRVVGDAALVSEAINSCLINYIQTPFIVASTLTICFLTSWQLSLIIFIGFPLLLFPIIYFAKHVKRISKQIQQNQERFASVLIDFLAGIQTVKLFAMESFSLKKYQDQNQRMAKLEQKSARYDLLTRPVVHTIAMVFLATALLFGLYVLQMSITDVLVYCGMLYLFYEPIKKFAEENTHIQRGVSAAERIFDIIALKPLLEDDKGKTNLSKFNDAIEFKHVWFKYDQEWVLKDLCFRVKKGETVAIVGPTGAGKSTIVQLLPRLYDVQKGEIRIDDVPIATFTQRSLRDIVGFVPQKPFLFIDTISENISFGRDFSEDEIKSAAEKAHIHQFIMTLPNNYQTELAESGKNLSGGQQQRLAIARALVKQAPILIMDEATSSLDAISENYIKSAIRELRGQVTQIIIAHRLSTIEDADRIIYLERGQKVAEGTKDELLKKCTGFRLMWEMLHQSHKPS